MQRKQFLLKAFGQQLLQGSFMEEAVEVRLHRDVENFFAECSELVFRNLAQSQVVLGQVTKPTEVGFRHEKSMPCAPHPVASTRSPKPLLYKHSPKP